MNERARELIEQNSALQDLIATREWQVFSRLANDAIAPFEARLLAGRLDDIGEYKLLSGWIDGARQLLGIPQEIARRLRQVEEEERERVEEEAETGYAPVE